jgi:uncharacterized protein (TIGR03067 family)
MYRFIVSVLLLTVACAAVAKEPLDKAGKDSALNDRPSFAGAWEIAEVRPEGAAKQAVRLLFIKDGTYAALDKDGQELWAGTFEIVPTTTPSFWDHRSHDAKKASEDQLGVYELEGDRLRLACVGGHWRGNEWIGRPRPKAIDPREADVVLELRRVEHSNNTSNQSLQLGGGSMPEDLSELATDFIRMVNENDPNGFVAMFEDDAIVDDAGRIIRGRDAIRQWAAHDIYAASVTLDALDVNEYECGITITAKIDGTFDRKGLPDPLVMTFDIALRCGEIARLTCRLADN